MTPSRHPNGIARWARRAARGIGASARGLAAAVVVVSLTTLLGAPAADAARHTPERWRAVVETHPDSHFVGQRKHIGWNRDRNANFLDDEIERRFRRGDSVDVVVELNRCMLPQSARALLAEFGEVTYIGRLITCAYMRGVRFEDLRRLAALPEIAMVEWQTPFRSAVGVTTRAIQAVESKSYGDGNAVRTSTDKSGDGSGTVIAVFDCGVVNGQATIPYSGSADAASFVGGFDATIFEDGVIPNGVDDSFEDKSTCGAVCQDEPGDGSTDPDPDPVSSVQHHGTQVAFIALGRAALSATCRQGTDEDVAPACEGVAPAAGLIDVKVCEDQTNCDFRKTADGNIMQGIDWLARYHETHPVDVANFSLFDASSCDGTCALCEAVNYLSFIGIVPVVCLGNAGCTGPADCDPGEIEAGTTLVSSPGAATYAITVQASSDDGSVDRDDDDLYEFHLEGPRDMPAGFVTDPLGAKPDLTAPGVSVETLSASGSLVDVTGTSFAAPLVAGAAALIRQRMPTASPAIVKDLLLRTADRASITGSSIAERYGAGYLNVYAALNAEKLTDVAFPSCDTSLDPADSGSPCPLEAGMDDWMNYRDIEYTGVFGLSMEVEFQVHVENLDSQTATDVIVSLAARPFGAGSDVFEEIGSQTVTMAGGESRTLSYPWTVPTDGWICVQATIHYGLDTQPGNNVTRRNIHAAASRYDVSVENPFLVPAEFRVVAASERANWICAASESTFSLGGMEDCGKNVRVTFRAPAEARRRDRATCNVSVFAKTAAMKQERLVGGVTVVTYVPEDCQISGRVVDESGRPIPGAHMVFTRDLPAGLLRGAWERDRTARTDQTGRFSTAIVPDAHQTLRVALPGRKEFMTLEFRSVCDDRSWRVVTGQRGIRLTR